MAFGDVRRPGSAAADGREGTSLALLPVVLRNGLIDDLANQACHRDTLALCLRAQASHLVRCQGDLGPDHRTMITIWPG
jgi:hypothetical protein